VLVQADLNNYSFKVVLTSKKNQYRVKQIDYTGQPRFSKTVDFMSTTPEITFSPAKVSKSINFLAGETPAETMFEIYDHMVILLNADSPQQLTHLTFQKEHLSELRQRWGSSSKNNTKYYFNEKIPNSKIRDFFLR